jgi:hypothetical protein
MRCHQGCAREVLGHACALVRDRRWTVGHALEQSVSLGQVLRLHIICVCTSHCIERGKSRLSGSWQRSCLGVLAGVSLGGSWQGCPSGDPDRGHLEGDPIRGHL